MKSKTIILGKEYPEQYIYNLVGLNLQYVMDHEIKKILFVCPVTGIIINKAPLDIHFTYEQFIFFVQQMFITSISSLGDGYCDSQQATEPDSFKMVIKKINFNVRLN